jgi:ABC-type cobalamin transport system ATPase subunit
MIKVIYYLKQQYLAVIITVLWIFFTLYTQNKTAILIEQSKKLEITIDNLKLKDKLSGKIIDSLSKVDTIIVNKIKIIKQKEYVQIKGVDSLNISELQEFFSKRYSGK